MFEIKDLNHINMVVKDVEVSKRVYYMKYRSRF